MTSSEAHIWCSNENDPLLHRPYYYDYIFLKT